MTDAIKDILPLKRMDQLQTDLAAELKAHPGKPVLLYISGVEPNGKPCPACVNFERTQHDTLQAHKGRTTFAQVQVPLTYDAFVRLASTVGATVEGNTLKDASTGASGPMATPLLMQLGLDKDGKLEVKAMRGGAGELDAWLTGFERTGKAQTQAKAAVAGCNVVQATTCKPDESMAALLKSLQGKTADGRSK